MDDNSEQIAAALVVAAAAAAAACNCTKPVQNKKYALQVILTSIDRPFFSASLSLKKFECLCRNGQRTPDEAFFNNIPISGANCWAFGVYLAKLMAGNFKGAFWYSVH